MKDPEPEELLENDETIVSARSLVETSFTSTSYKSNEALKRSSSDVDGWHGLNIEEQLEDGG